MAEGVVKMADWRIRTRLILKLSVCTVLLAGCTSFEWVQVADLAMEFEDDVATTVYFGFDEDELDDEARAVLDVQADWIHGYPELWFRVYGHTDAVGTAEYNQQLGLRRANATFDYLVSRGVDPERLEVLLSYGETRLAIDSAERERANRRVHTAVAGFVEQKTCDCRARPRFEETRFVAVRATTHQGENP